MKCDELTMSGRVESVQVSGAPNHAQLRNITVVNTLHIFNTIMNQVKTCSISASLVPRPPPLERLGTRLHQYLQYVCWACTYILHQRAQHRQYVTDDNSSFCDCKFKLYCFSFQHVLSLSSLPEVAKKIINEELQVHVALYEFQTIVP